MMHNRSLGFIPAGAGVAACTAAVMIIGGVAFWSGPARTESTSRVSLSTISNPAPASAADQATLEDSARQAAVQQLAEAMRRKAREEQATADKAQGAPAQPEVATTTTGSAASASIAKAEPETASTQTGGAQVALSVQPPSAPMQVASIAPEDMQRLAGKAAEAIRSGDIASARLVLEHAARAGDATALYALAETYDPRVLVKMRVQGMTGDPETARNLYQRALDSGVEEARSRLSQGG
ncbi:MAG: hypothetical protein JWM36_151 [Hyphomicrobiales bacterium]|nr:hypothetical protein [Hyphomicrobiales bacterium]